MTVNLYSTTDDPKKLIKSITQIGSSITCKPGEPCSILTPTIILNYDDTYISANYAYISAWGRYYFLNPPIMLTGRRLQFNGSVDPLMSWHQNILDIDCTVVRSESVGVNYMPDSKLPVDPSRSFVEGILFPNDPLTPDTTDSYFYVLTVNGGSGS